MSDSNLKTIFVADLAQLNHSTPLTERKLVLNDRAQPVAALVSIEDLRRLHELDQLDKEIELGYNEYADEQDAKPPFAIVINEQIVRWPDKEITYHEVLLRAFDRCDLSAEVTFTKADSNPSSGTLDTAGTIKVKKGTIITVVESC